ncbi:hypothetical protein [Candidatus Nitrosotenuis uzonensis]|uniref:Type IV pilin n=1 Tax=Candidatus Nitrosotenuis uzonensis TaxID=1407055 RepID=A0A812EYV0_9ARCH|nr:hypothetical protein [Candidatus Nitrosotenuis uzonensis]CAE6485689.1 conserved exported hypothetical protein [Candidatus Nitrosotenuis uzonensis]
MRKRKAISPAIVTLLLMAVAISGGIAVWQSMNSQAQTISKISKLDIVDVSLAKLQVGGKAFFSVTLKNSGTVDFDAIEAGFWDDTNKYVSFIKNSANLLPGVQWAENDVIDANITPNQKYTIKVIGTTSDGSTFSMAKTVFAMG